MFKDSQDKRAVNRTWMAQYQSVYIKPVFFFKHV